MVTLKNISQTINKQGRMTINAAPTFKQVGNASRFAYISCALAYIIEDEKEETTQEMVKKAKLRGPFSFKMQLPMQRSDDEMLSWAQDVLAVALHVQKSVFQNRITIKLDSQKASAPGNCSLVSARIFVGEKMCCRMRIWKTSDR